jgi:hypothetical protein
MVIHHSKPVFGSLEYPFGGKVHLFVVTLLHIVQQLPVIKIRAYYLYC